MEENIIKSITEQIVVEKSTDGIFNENIEHTNNAFRQQKLDNALKNKITETNRKTKTKGNTSKNDNKYSQILKSSVNKKNTK